ncbi:hypothetical protein ACJRO7_030672 [Eucalyptus globulus]|uniref:Response regulatory domain-containing protein n=1 Tax=Eucalyptus globulus TaxID=34317 RepID=A0ABD3JEH2_EUCGL
MERAVPNKNSNASSEDGDQFQKGLRVLVVDDNVTCLHLLEKMLQDCSYQDNFTTLLRVLCSYFNFVCGIATELQKRENSHFCTRKLEMSHTLTTSSSNTIHSQAEHEKGNSKSLKRSSKDEADQGQTKSEENKPRLKILQIMRKLMGVPHFTRQNKCLLNQPCCTEISHELHQSAHSSLIKGPGFANPIHSTPPSSLLNRCGGTQNGADSAQFPSQAMSIAPPQQRTGCSMRMPNLDEFLNNNALPRYQMDLAPITATCTVAATESTSPELQSPAASESAQCLPCAPAPSVGIPLEDLGFGEDVPLLNS